jgi:hypothetical protein
MLNEKNADISIKANWGQDYKSAKEHLDELTKILAPLKEQGLVDFKATIFRKCDFCGKKLEENDKFITIGDLDKCEKCQRRYSNKPKDI